MKTILLINPWIYDFTAFDLWSKPLGLLYLAAHLRKTGYQVMLLDCMDRSLDSLPASQNKGSRQLRRYGCGSYRKTVLPKPAVLNRVPRYWGRFGLPYQQVIDYLKDIPEPDLIMITGPMTYWYPGVVSMRDLVHRFWPRAPILLGGVLPSLCPDFTQNLGFDSIPSGDPLTVGRTLSSRYAIDLDLEDYSGFFTVRPAYSLYKHLSYAVVLTSIGCPYRCTYCASHQLFPRFWQREPYDVFQEIQELVTVRSIQDIAFYDDALLYRATDLFIPLMEQVLAYRLSVRFHLPNSIHARYVTAEIARLMYRAGVKTVRISLEGTTESIQQKSRGKVDMDIFSQAVELLLTAGFPRQEIEVYLLFGIPGLTENDYYSTVYNLSRMGVKPRLSLYSPLPGTPEYQNAFWAFDQADPLYQNKIAMLYLSEQHVLYENLSALISSSKA